MSLSLQWLCCLPALCVSLSTDPSLPSISSRSEGCHFHFVHSVWRRVLPVPSAQLKRSRALSCDVTAGAQNLVSVMRQEGGRLAVLGSCHMFSDQYLDKEENSKIMVSISGQTSQYSVQSVCFDVVATV